MTLTNNQDFAEVVMTKIETEQIKTYSRVWFVAHDVVFWACWFVSALFGALALAVTLYVLTSLDAKVYLITHNSVFTYILDVLPYVWMLSFVGMCIIAHINLRRTPHGYRYSAWLLVVLNMSITIILAILLFATGLGKFLDDRAATYVPHYKSTAARQELRWFSPQDGLLIGEVVQVNDVTRYFVLQAPGDLELQVDGRLLNNTEWTLLEVPRVHVRVIAMPQPTSTFVACVVLPVSSSTTVPFDENLRERIFHEPRSIECRGIRSYERFDKLQNF